MPPSHAAVVPSPLVVTHAPFTSSDLVVELDDVPDEPDSLVVPPIDMAAFTTEYVPVLSYDDESFA